MTTKSTPAVHAVQAAGIAFRLLEYDYDPGMVFKTLIVALDTGELVCAVIPSDARLNVKALAAAMGVKRADMADPTKAQRSSGYVVGGISPFGQRKRLRTVVDARAQALPEIVVNGGRRGLQIALKPADLVAALSATALPITSA